MYADYLLTDEEDDAQLKNMCQNVLFGEVKAIVGIAYLEEDDNRYGPIDKTKMDEFMDAHGLLLELQDELAQLTSDKLTHVGVGFAENRQMVKIVELLCVRPLMVSNISQSEDGGVEVRGAMLTKDAGLYAARIIDPCLLYTSDAADE